MEKVSDELQNLKNQMLNYDDTPLTLRVRRQKTTYFISSACNQSIDTVKRKILVFHKGLDVGDIRLFSSNRVKDCIRQLLDEKSNIHDQGILNNSLIYYKLKKGSTSRYRQTRASGRTSLKWHSENDPYKIAVAI